MADRTRLLFDSIQAMYQAASAGLGLALGLRSPRGSFLNDGRLCVAGEQRYRMPGAYYVATTRRALQQKAVRALWHWIAREGRAVASATGPATAEL